MDNRKLLEVDFQHLNVTGSYYDEISFEGLIDALSAYKQMHEALTVASENPFHEEWRPFAFELHITTEAPYIITTQIYLV